MSCCHCSPQNNQHLKTFIIKNPKSGMVLDATDYLVKIQCPNGSCAQLWSLECVNYGRFVIINKANGKILNVENGATSGANLITYGRTPGLVHDNEQWHIESDGTILCAADGGFVVDIRGSKYQAGSSLIAYRKHKTDNQIFKLEYQTK